MPLSLRTPEPREMPEHRDRRRGSAAGFEVVVGLSRDNALSPLQLSWLSTARFAAQIFFCGTPCLPVEKVHDPHPSYGRESYDRE
jgi:hypothetical protein